MLNNEKFEKQYRQAAEKYDNMLPEDVFGDNEEESLYADHPYCGLKCSECEDYERCVDYGYYNDSEDEE